MTGQSGVPAVFGLSGIPLFVIDAGNRYWRFGGSKG